MDRDTQTIPIKQFVSYMSKFDTCFDNETLFLCCRALDRENKGSISLDDFISFSEQVQQEAEEDNQAKAD